MCAHSVDRTARAGIRIPRTKPPRRREHGRELRGTLTLEDSVTLDLPPDTDDLPPPDSDAWDAGLPAAFTTPDEAPRPSVLARLEQLAGRDARVLLRDAGTQSAPVVRAGDAAGQHSGRDVDLGRDLTMKVLRDDHAGNAELVQRFVEEARSDDLESARG